MVSDILLQLYFIQEYTSSEKPVYNIQILIVQNILYLNLIQRQKIYFTIINSNLAYLHENEFRLSRSGMKVFGFQFSERLPLVSSSLLDLAEQQRLTELNCKYQFGWKFTANKRINTSIWILIYAKFQSETLSHSKTFTTLFWQFRKYQQKVFFVYNTFTLVFAEALFNIFSRLDSKTLQPSLVYIVFFIILQLFTKPVRKCLINKDERIT